MCHLNITWAGMPDFLPELADCMKWMFYELIQLLMDLVWRRERKHRPHP